MTQQPIETLINPAGRVSLKTLEQLAALYDPETFVAFVRRPVLAGSGIQSGAVSPRARDKIANATMLLCLEPETVDDMGSGPDALKLAVYPLVKEHSNPRTSNLFAIGRVSGNDLIIPDIAISKQHASIEIQEGTRFFLRDNGSTNGTQINGYRIDSNYCELHDGDVVTFARYEFNFMLPRTLYANLMAR